MRFVLMCRVTVSGAWRGAGSWSAFGITNRRRNRSKLPKSRQAARPRCRHACDGLDVLSGAVWDLLRPRRFWLP